MDEIKKHLDKLISLCNKYNVDKLYVFGSALTSSFDKENSDIDLLVNLSIVDSIERGEALIGLWNDLEAVFNRKVDLVTEDSIRNPYLKSNIDHTKKLIYEREEVPV
jgi:predicted nucleotidyltransferase